MDGWIVIPNWAKFQAYTDRNPPWIKLWTELNSRDDWIALTCAQRGLLTTCWIEYARSRGLARLSHVASIAGAGFKHAYFKPLIDAGFIQVVANKPQPIVRPKPKPEKRREEKKEPLDASPKNPQPQKPVERTPFSAPPTPGRVNMPPSDPVAYVEALIRNGVITEPTDLEGYDLDDTTLHQLRVRLGG